MPAKDTDAKSTAERIKLLDDFAAAYNRHDVDGILGYMTADCVFVSYFGPEAFGERFQGAETVRARVASFLSDFPDARWSDLRHFVSAGRGVSEWTFTGTRKGTTERQERRGCDLFTFRDGKIAVKDSYHKWRQPAQQRREVDVPSIHRPVGRYAHAVRYRDMLFISGCGPFDTNGQIVGVGDIVAQTEQTLSNAQAILAAAGLTFANVIKETVYLTDIDDRQATRHVREKFYGSTLPASTLLEISKCVVPEMKIEVDLVAGC